MFKVILVATDGSAHGERAVTVASDIAGSFGARLVILTVIPPGPPPQAIMNVINHERAPSPHPMLAGLPSWFDDALSATREGTGEAHALVEALARETLYQGSRVARQHGAETCETVTEHGDPAETILRYAKKENADLIVLGRRGLGNIEEFVLGSVSHKVMQKADRNCLTVP
jgi:nucleotide-binding universal stress UspA family protein